MVAYREDPETVECEPTTESHVVFVAVDEDREPTSVPAFTVSTEEGKRLRREDRVGENGTGQSPPGVPIDRVSERRNDFTRVWPMAIVGAMATTVQVSEETRDRLAQYKEAVGADTYEEAIVHLLRQTAEESAFGSIRGWGSWTEVDRSRTRSDEGDV